MSKLSYLFLQGARWRNVVKAQSLLIRKKKRGMKLWKL